MSELIKIDDSTHYDPGTGEEYYSIDWSLSHREQKEHIVRQLKNVVEQLVSVRIGEDSAIPPTSLEEYLQILVAFKPYLIGVDGTNTYACTKIAEESISSGKMYEAISGIWFIDIDRVKIAYKDSLTAIADELIQYRTLQGIRAQLKQIDLIKHLQTLFVKHVSSMARFHANSVISDIEAELSLLLTVDEEEQQLKEGYANRLDLYKERAKISAVHKPNFEFLPWQCFTSKHLVRCCEDFIGGYINGSPTGIELDLALTNRSFYYSEANIFYHNAIITETVELIAEWQVIEWIKEKLIPNKKQSTASVDDESKSNKTVTQAQLALFYSYCHEKGCLPAFRAGKLEQEYKKAVEPYKLSWKSFQQHYNRFSQMKSERMAEGNRVALLAAIKMLESYPKALEMAKDELNTAQTRKPLT